MESPERTVQFRASALMTELTESKPKRKRKSPQPHWYKMHVGECPVCGHDQSYRIRVYGEPPADIKDRYEYLSDTETYDHCQG